jgi:hypothetical protein
MTTLIAERRRALENDDAQESLFGGEAFAPARKPSPWQRPAQPAGEARAVVEPAASMQVSAQSRDVPSHAELLAGEELVALERATVADDVRKPRAPLAGPTLDDVMSRVWEGLVTGLPAACPVCRGEVVPSVHGALHGRCSSCGTTID